MFLFRNLVLSAPVAFAVAVNMLPSVSAAPWWPMHFVMEEDPSSALSAASSLPLESTFVASTAIVSATIVPTAISSAIVESTPVLESTDIFPSVSASEPQPSADSTVSGVKDLSAAQTSGTVSIRGLGGTAAILGSTATMLFLVL